MLFDNFFLSITQFYHHRHRKVSNKIHLVVDKLFKKAFFLQVRRAARNVNNNSLINISKRRRTLDYHRVFTFYIFFFWKGNREKEENKKRINPWKIKQFMKNSLVHFVVDSRVLNLPSSFAVGRNEKFS